MPRVCILLLDSLGIGASHDSESYGDAGANTLFHIHENYPSLNIPNLMNLGIYHALVASSGIESINLKEMNLPSAWYGYAVETSLGKDTPSGHWELMGVPVYEQWRYFPDTQNCFPEDFINSLVRQANLPGFLGEIHASGTDIIEKLGVEHIKTGKPIIYTSADSVVQIAAHEHYFGLEKLYKICKIARTLLDPLNVGRVIARPFIGEDNNFKRTANRKDYSMPPPKPTLLDYLYNSGKQVIGVGKTADIFANSGISKSILGDGNMDLFSKTLAAFKDLPDGGLLFTNFVDFDSSYGHRRDVVGYGNALEEFDKRLPEIVNQLHDEDWLVITADHGCDPTFPGSDHTREHVPLLIFGRKLQSRFIGRRDSFADLAQTLADYLGIDAIFPANSFLHT